MGKLQPADLLPEITRNKAYEKKQKFIEKKKLKELRRENPQAAARLEKAKLKKQLAAKKASLADKAQGKAPSQKTGAAQKKVEAVGEKKKKQRRPKTVVANAPTGRETFTKKKARELVKEKRKEKRKERRKGLAPTKENQSVRDGGVAIPTAVPSSSSSSSLRVGEPRVGKEKSSRSTHLASHDDDEEAPWSVVGSHDGSADLDQMLLQRTIRGAGGDGEEDASSADPFLLVRRDPSLYPSDVPFYQDYAEKQQAQAVSEDALLKHAHDYFKKVGQREKRLNMAAAAYLRKMKEVNRKGGDKDGFQYVVPKNVKAVVKMMRENEQQQRHAANGESVEWVDSDALRSTFGGDGVEETSDKPMRRRKKKRSTFSDFYQFQVSKRWTRNAESFLNRGRAHKSLFEAKKRQRSIRKL